MYCQDLQFRRKCQEEKMIPHKILYEDTIHSLA